MSRVKNTDYLILGGGCSGLTSAISAREAGVKSVTVVEARKIFGGSGRMQMSLAGVDTPYQRKHGVHVHADDFAREVTHANHYMQNNKLIWEMFMDSSARHAWLESLGVEWQDVRAMTGTRRVAHIHETGGIGTMDTGVVIMDKLLEEINRIGGVNMVNETRAKKLLQDETGKVIGAQVEDKDGIYDITARAVLISTGSITGNKELRKKLFPEINFESDHMRIVSDLPWLQGEGYLMAQDAGCDKGIMGFHYYGPDALTSNRGVMLVHRPEMMTVNKFGKRFVNEDLSATTDDHVIIGNALSREPDTVCFCIIDEVHIQEMMRLRLRINGYEDNFAQTVDDDFAGNMNTDDPGAVQYFGNSDVMSWMNDLPGHYREQEKKFGTMKICQTLDEVADFIGCDHDVFKAQVNRMNKFADEGFDAELGKDSKWLKSLRAAPYYVVRAVQGLDNINGGIAITDEFQAVRDNTPVVGLYATGNIASGLVGAGTGGDGYCWAGPWAYFGGYKTGKTVAKAMADGKI